MFSSTGVLGRIVRSPLRLIPTDMVVPVLRGPLRGIKWIVGSGYHGCWLGSYESEKQRKIAAELKPGSVFYDVGANVGLYSLLAARQVHPGMAYAFEPLPQNVWYLRKHLELNDIHNVDVLELAVSDRSGTACFEKSGNRSMGHLAEGGNIRVCTATLDSLVFSERIFPPSCIKMDIEGAELLALRGAGESIQRYRPVIFLATHGREVHRECSQLLESWGYECLSIQDKTGSDAGEVVAKFHWNSL
jgi:FkbM family methyltransferase